MRGACLRTPAVLQGGDFIQLTRQMTGAKVSVDRLLPDAEERIVHVISRDE
jgi:hypothetical protein